MNKFDPPETFSTQTTDTRGSRMWLVVYIMLPLLLLGMAATWLVASDPLRVFSTAAPPVEKLTVERSFVDDTGIHLKIRAGGAKPMIIAQVQVDDAYWRFAQKPGGPLPRLSAAWLHIPYPWILGERHVVKLLTNTGATFEHEIEVAVARPNGQVGSWRTQAVVGAFVGILPVAIGLMFFPLLQRLGRQGMRFTLALTCGLLVFLLIDMLENAIGLSTKAAPAFQGPVMVLLVAAITCLGLISIGRRRGSPSGLALATFLALGIGLHNLGEGLAIGAALAAGSSSLGAFLVLGFTIHNVTEGIGIAAPLVRNRPPLTTFVGLALLAGAPAILGIWLGSYAIAPQWASLALAIGIGAIVQVLFELGTLTLRGTEKTENPLDRYILGGFICGVTFMYLTGMAIKI